MTQDLLDQQLDKSIEAFCVIPEVTAELAENLVSQGFFTFDDLSVIEPDQLAEIGGLSDEDCDKIVEYADRESQRLEAEEKIAAELKKQSAGQGEAPKPKVAPPVAEAAIQEPETVPPEAVVDSSAVVEE
jgi:N utilization substance protein A